MSFLQLEVSYNIAQAIVLMINQSKSYLERKVTVHHWLTSCHKEKGNSKY